MATQLTTGFSVIRENLESAINSANQELDREIHIRRVRRIDLEATEEIPLSLRSTVIEVPLPNPQELSLREPTKLERIRGVYTVILTPKGVLGPRPIEICTV